jgi:hypothetical protein
MTTPPAFPPPRGPRLARAHVNWALTTAQAVHLRRAGLAAGVGGSNVVALAGGCHGTHSLDWLAPAAVLPGPVPLARLGPEAAHVAVRLWAGGVAVGAGRLLLAAGDKAVLDMETYVWPSAWGAVPPVALHVSFDVALTRAPGRPHARFLGTVGEPLRLRLRPPVAAPSRPFLELDGPANEMNEAGPGAPGPAWPCDRGGTTSFCFVGPAVAAGGRDAAFAADAAVLAYRVGGVVDLGPPMSARVGLLDADGEHWPEYLRLLTAALGLDAGAALTGPCGLPLPAPLAPSRAFADWEGFLHDLPVLVPPRPRPAPSPAR